jgi:hypothetical protein
MRRGGSGGDVKTYEKSSATNRAILSLVVLMKTLGLFRRALTLTQEKSSIFPLGVVHKQRRLKISKIFDPLPSLAIFFGVLRGSFY